MRWGELVILVVMLSPAIGLFVLAMVPSSKVKIILPKRKPKAEVDPWAGWKAIKANLDASRKAEHDDWQTDFNRLVQDTCAHSFPATSQNPTYFTCYKCGYEEPWEFVEDGCGCHFTEVKTLSSPFPEYNVTFRYGNCVWHGVDWENFGKQSDRSNKPFKSVKELTR